MAYDLEPVQSPVTSGALLKTLVSLAEGKVTGALLAKKMLTDVGIAHFRQVPTDEHHPGGPPTQPIIGVLETHAPKNDPQKIAQELASPAITGDAFSPITTADYVARYAEGSTTPDAVAEAFLKQLESSQSHTPSMSFFIAQNADDLRAQANESTRRYADGTQKGPLDGVPIAVKDELDQHGYPTTVGTRFMGTENAEKDAEVVRRLREAGALLVGKANMHEIGMGVTGFNLHYGTARNPFNPNHSTGGSSSGSAAIVGAGLCPIAVGADGGGSIRIPASFCGAYGLKSTFGRLSEHGAAPLCWSLAHVGPIASSVRDLAIAYSIMAGPDTADANSLRQPPVTLEDLSDSDLGSIRIGVFEPWFNDADPDIVAACRRMLAHFEQAGATLVPIEIPELSLVRSAHLVTIATEIATAQRANYQKHRKDYAPDIRLKLALAQQLTGADYVHAQRHRVRLTQHFLSVLNTVDLIATPTTGSTAPAWSPKALKYGESNLGLATHIMKYALPANLTGLPAISMPVGYDSDGLPIGLQLLGNHWQEALLLRMAHVSEQTVASKKPDVYLPPITR